MSYDASKWQILHNMASNGLVRLVVGCCGQLWSRIASLIELVHFKVELRNLGLIYRIMACMALCDMIDQILPNVAYYRPIFVIVSTYDRLGAYLSLYYLF